MTTDINSCTLILVLVVVCAVFAICGCGGGDDGPVKYTLSGMVTYEGRPVPIGDIMFEPDTARGNRGPGGIAPINNGNYRTKTGKGVLGGPYIARIAGFDGVPYENEEGQRNELGKELFPAIRLEVTFPAADTTYDFMLPPTDTSGSEFDPD